MNVSEALLFILMFKAIIREVRMGLLGIEAVLFGLLYKAIKEDADGTT